MSRILLVAFLLFASTVSGEAPAKAKPAAPAPQSTAAPLPAAAVKAFKARAIGPATMGGRVAEIALDPRNPYTFYVALGTGGVMKTVDGGGSFKDVFKTEAVAAAGAVAVALSDPKVVWVGTGEANDRNSSSWGNGVYRSTDAGESWSHVGLTGSRSIARLVVHPTDPATAWVAVAGDLWGPSPERGLFKTADAGKTWKAVLTTAGPYADRVGCGDVALDPQDPNVLYATLYARQRTPWSFVSGPAATDGKDLGGLFKSTDGGATWRKLDKGLPGSTQRIGIAVSPRNSKLLYALVQTDEGGTAGIRDVHSKRGGVFRSEDGGESWTRTSPLDPRPFYFSQVRVDPENDQRIYVLGFAVHVSEDGGRSFREDRFEKVHPDCHALAVDPRSPARLLLGTDGGVYQSFDGGEHWQHLNTMAAGEFYRINVDLGRPYRICGGLQDNSNWVGPSATLSEEGIRNSDWINIGGGDGFACAFDPDNPNLVYTESQQGDAHRFDLASGQHKGFRPEPPEGQPSFRFHWAAPMVGSRHAKGALYFAGNHVFRLTEHGEHWQRISPDLSAQDPRKTSASGSGAETYGVVYTLAESPLKAGLLWAGTDDGKLWLTENDGGSWTDLTASLPAAVKGQWLSRVEAGAHDPKVAYLAVDAHRSQVFSPLAYRTADGGRSWQSISGTLPADGPVKVVREDPRNPDVLYAGTEFGLFASIDRGRSWVRFGELPTVAVDDIVVHPRDNDLVVATHGRSLYVVDDVRPLQDLTPEVQGKDAFLFPPRPAFGRPLLEGWAASAGTAGFFKGANPPEGALLTVYVKEFSGEPLEIMIKNAAGVPVAKLKAPGLPGFNRLNWDLKPSKELLTEYGGEGPLFVKPGEYTVSLSYGKTKQEQKLSVEIAPGVETR